MLLAVKECRWIGKYLSTPGTGSFSLPIVSLFQKSSGEQKMLHHSTQGYLQVMGIINYRKKKKEQKCLCTANSLVLSQLPGF